MVLCFSGTGNSLHAAKSLSNGQEILMIKDCIEKKSFHITGDTLQLGIVCPVYFGGLPEPVYYFLSKCSFEKRPEYIWIVLTCGGKAYGAASQADYLLKQKGCTLDYHNSVVMPDNYIVMFDVPEEEEQEVILSAAEKKLERIAQDLKEKKTASLVPLADRMATTLMYPAYAKGRSTKKFFTDDRCIGCGTCASRCPVGAIEMTDGRPVWVKEKCARCMACARCRAVQFGKQTAKRENRYTHPDLRKKAHCH